MMRSWCTIVLLVASCSVLSKSVQGAFLSDREVVKRHYV